MAGIDVCQKLSGVTLKLLAFERMLSEYPNHKEEVGPGRLVQTFSCLQTSRLNLNHSIVRTHS